MLKKIKSYKHLTNPSKKLNEMVNKMKLNSYLDLDFRIYIPLLTFFWFFTHVVEAFVIQHYMNQNGSEYIKSVIHNFNKTVGV